MNKGEYGNIFRFNANQDISSATPTLIFEPRFGARKERTTTDGVTVPGVSVTVDGETFKANQYAEYTFKDGDLDRSGRWRAKLVAQFSATEKLISDYVRFTVMP